MLPCKAVKQKVKVYLFFTLMSTFLVSTFAPFLSKTMVVGFLTTTAGLAGTTMTSFFSVDSFEQDMKISAVTMERVLMICFIKFFKLKTLHLFRRLMALYSSQGNMSNTVPLKSKHR